MLKEYRVYVLRSKKDGKRYIGSTSNIQRRLAEHNKGLVKSTRNRRPLELVYSEVFADKTSAMEREKFLKTGRGREYLRDQGY